MEKLILPAPAKLNLFLHINAQRANGYHELQTIFQFIDYCDELTFMMRVDRQIHLHAKVAGVSTHNNLISRAARLMQHHDKKRRGIDIYLKKNIPLGAGLGGGSSDAATTMLALNHLWDLNLPFSQLLQLGLQLGADIPVFLQGQACWAENLGEQMFPLDLPTPWFVVVVPSVHISTAEIFCDPKLTRDTPKTDISLSLLETGENDCQPTVTRLYPEVAQALNWLNQFSTAQMTGTGGAVFARFENEIQANEVIAQLPDTFKGFAAPGLNTSPLLTTLKINR